MIIIDREDCNTNYPMCAMCGGKCCKRNACDCSPKDFDNDIEKMRKALESGKYSIDFSRTTSNSFSIGRFETVLISERVIRAEAEFFYVRPKNVGRPTVDIIHDKDRDEGPCIFWDKEKGCSLSYEEKPMGGRTLVPIMPDMCMGQYNTAMMLIEWKPFTKQLVELAKKFFDPTWPIYQQFNLRIE